MPIDPFYFCVCLIIMMKGTNEVGQATGFFYEANEKSYLVSNRHVFNNEKMPAEKRPDHLILPLHVENAPLTTRRHISLLLTRTNGVRIWVAATNGPADVVMLPLDRGALGDAKVTWLSRSAFMRSDTPVVPGEDVLVLGYPGGIHDMLNNLPIVRNGLVSSVHGVPFQGLPCFLVEARLYPGSSGSPVFTKPRTQFGSAANTIHLESKPTMFLLGIFSGPLETWHGIDTKNMDLCAVC